MPACDCGKTITWKRIGGKMHKLNPDGSNHWADCTHRKSKPGAVKVLKGERITGKDYRPSCACTTPPWEDCEHSQERAQKWSAVMVVNTEADERFQRLLDLAEAL